MFLRTILKVWGESYYTKPLLEIVALYCLFSIVKRKKKDEDFSLPAAVFCCAIVFLFVTIDISYGIVKAYKTKIHFHQFVQFVEFLNGMFGFIELYTIFRIVNYGSISKKLENWGKVLFGMILLKECALRLVIFHYRDVDSIQGLDELSAGISYALFTLYFTYYYFTLYKKNIMSTFVAPSAYMMFCYVVLSLLSFPCSQYFVMQKSNVGFAIYAYHSVLAAMTCLVLRYNVVKHQSNKLNFLEFHI
ncbi:MAG: hypothetical protein EOP48_15215 [Sphingobacteriales bacterium]|nr:MAG: hypothetical protein EOP48_15215 [Sphingobacteriales bacterium]